MTENIERESIELIESIASKRENQIATSNWYCIAVSEHYFCNSFSLKISQACAFTASGQGPLVAEVYKAAILPFFADPVSRRLILRRIKGLFRLPQELLETKRLESLITSSFIFGVPRLLNAFFPLMKAIPDSASQDNTNFRISIPSLSSVSARGEAYMRVVFGDGDLDTFLSMMEEYWPDLKSLIVNDVYGMYQAEVSVLGKVETSQINIASLVPMDCPSEVGWHMRGLIYNEGSMEELNEAFEIAKGVCEVCQVVLKKELPKVQDVIGKEKLISRHG